MVELAVVAEEFGRAAAPGPWSTTAVVAAALSGPANPALAKEVLPALADGTTSASLSVPVGAPDGTARARPGLRARSSPGGALVVSGTLGPILNGATVDTVLVPVELDGDERWVLVERGPGVSVEPVPSFDPSRRSARWTLDEVSLPAIRVVGELGTGRLRDLALVVFSAEATGGARWCLETAAEHAPDP